MVTECQLSVNQGVNQVSIKMFPYMLIKDGLSVLIDTQPWMLLVHLMYDLFLVWFCRILELQVFSISMFGTFSRQSENIGVIQGFK